MILWNIIIILPYTYYYIIPKGMIHKSTLFSTLILRYCTKSPLIILKKPNKIHSFMQHYENFSLALYWDSSHNGMIYKAHIKVKKSLGEKETCQCFMVNLTHLLCVLLY